MGNDVIIGNDGKMRCGWAGAGDTSLGRYHDEVWGTRTYDESALFEALTLGVFEAGLSWSIVPVRGAHERVRVHAERRRR
jgi:DNA-3-methyladenine glycosylase I